MKKSTEEDLMLRISILFFFISSNQIIFAQDYTKIFRSELPDKVFQDSTTQHSINSNIEFLASIHPKILYFYFDHLDRLIGKNLSKPDSNGAKQLKAAREYYFSKRTKWAENQINKFELQITNRLQKNAAIIEFEDFLYDDEKTTSLPSANDNQIEYYVYKYYKQVETLCFDPNSNYQKLNENYYALKLGEINKQILNFNKDNENTFNELIKEIKNYWFIEIEYPAILQSVKLSKEPSTIVMEYYSNKFFESGGLLLSAEQNLTMNEFVAFDEKLIYEDYVLPTFINPMQYEYSIKIVNTPVFSFGLGYKFKIKEEIGFVSNVKVSLLYNYLKSEVTFNEKNQYFYSFTYNVISGSSREEYVYHISDINNLNNQLLSLRIKTPVFHFKKYFYIEFGVGFDYHIFNFDVQFDRRAVLITNGNAEVLSTEERGEYKFDANMLYISPSLFLCYDIMGNLIINVAFIGNIDYPRVVLSMEFLL